MSSGLTVNLPNFGSMEMFTGISVPAKHYLDFWAFGSWISLTESADKSDALIGPGTCLVFRKRRGNIVKFIWKRCQ